MFAGRWPGNPYQNIYMTSHMLSAEIVHPSHIHPALGKLYEKMLNGL